MKSDNNLNTHLPRGKWLWKSDKGNIYIHCDDVIEIAKELSNEK